MKLKPADLLRRAPACLLAALCVFPLAELEAQELEPRSYANAPTGLHFLVLGYSFVTGGIETDPALPIEDAQLDVHGPILGYAQTFGIAGKSAKLDLIVPYGDLSGSAQIAGELAEREVGGFWDPKVRLSMNLYGAPALTPREFATYKQNWIVGASLQVGMPLGQYDSQRIVNLGTNRWSMKPEIGVSKALGKWTIDFAAAATFYTDNPNYPGGRVREQEPIYSFQGHLIWSLPRRMWIALNGTWYEGGVTALDGVEANNSLSSSRAGLTFSLPLGAQHSLKLAASRGLSVRTGSDFDAFGLFWQYRWRTPPRPTTPAAGG